MAFSSRFCYVVLALLVAVSAASACDTEAWLNCLTSTRCLEPTYSQTSECSTILTHCLVISKCNSATTNEKSYLAPSAVGGEANGSGSGSGSGSTTTVETSPTSSHSHPVEDEGDDDDSDNSVALGVGLGIGLGVPALAAGAFFFKKKRDSLLLSEHEDTSYQLAA